MNGKDFAIGILSVTAVILLTGFILVQAFTPQQAVAAGQTVTAGQYIVTAGQLDDVSDLIYIIDTVSQKMNVYGFEPQRGEIVLIQQLDVRTQAPPRGGQPRR